MLCRRQHNTPMSTFSGVMRQSVLVPGVADSLPLTSNATTDSSSDGFSCADSMTSSRPMESLQACGECARCEQMVEYIDILNIHILCDTPVA